MPPNSSASKEVVTAALLVIGNKILSGRTKDQNIGWPAGDITADCVAKAFGVPIDSDPRALAILHEWVKMTGA